jgi:hypothetical protein
MKLKNSRSALVRLHLRRMLTAINLNNQFIFNTAEVSYVRSDWMLATKFYAAGLPCS